LQIAQRQPWAKRSLEALVKEADDFPRAYDQRFGVNDGAAPLEGGQWLHWYACPESGRALQFRPPDQNICPDTGRNFSGYPYDHVVYQMRNDALAEAAVALALAYRFTHKDDYAQKAARILTDYARVYPTYALHDINGKTGPNGAKAYAQTLDESLWLIKIAWTYDLIRGANVLSSSEKHAIENDVLRASAAIVLKAHKEPTYNIQSWINGAAAAVGFTLNDRTLIKEAIDGPIGFRYQMHRFVTEGFWAEGAWGYQFYAMRPLTMTAQMAAHKGINLWKEEPNLVALFHSPLGVMLPNGRLPAFNDSGSPDLYEQDYLYEVAYAATSDAAMLNVIEHGARSDREAFLFGVETLPRTGAAKLVSTVFREAGYAALRSRDNDLTVIMKFGPHGGAHGHYDKLNFVLYSHGQTLAIDPGTHPYGIPIHREWDSMSIAHNTISVDQQRQSAATGKVLDWQVGDDWVAVRADAGAAYATANLERTVLLTSKYVLIADDCQSSDGESHTFDWAYHNTGVESLAQSLTMTPFQLPGTNGYQHLSETLHGQTSGAITTHFISTPQAPHSESESNSTPATYYSSKPSFRDQTAPREKVELHLQMLPSVNSEVITGRAPSRSSASPIPFLIVRRSGMSASFGALITVNEEKKGVSPGLTLEQNNSNEFLIRGSGVIDTFFRGGRLSLKHR